MGYRRRIGERRLIGDLLLCFRGDGDRRRRLVNDGDRRPRCPRGDGDRRRIGLRRLPLGDGLRRPRPRGDGDRLIYIVRI